MQPIMLTKIQIVKMKLKTVKYEIKLLPFHCENSLQPYVNDQYVKKRLVLVLHYDRLSY